MVAEYKLAGGFKHVFFSMIYGIILPIDSYFSRWLLHHQPVRNAIFHLNGCNLSHVNVAFDSPNECSLFAYHSNQFVSYWSC